MANGKVKWFNATKGWGFVTDHQGQDAFVHHTNIEGQRGFKTLNTGDEVSYDVTHGEKGLVASRVRVTNPAPAAAAK